MVLVLVRIALLAVAAVLTSAVAAAVTGRPFSLAYAAQLSAHYFVPVNVACWALLARGGGVRRLLGERPWLRWSDVGYGLVWLLVMYVPFAAAVVLMALLLHGPAGFADSFATMFVPPEGTGLDLGPVAGVVFAAVVVALFPLTNAPVEELYYRGHAQGRLEARGAPGWLVVLLPAALFGLQHVLLAPGPEAMAVYAVAFTAWGATAGVIYRRRRRLMPLIVAHFLTNLFTAAVPLAFVLFGT